MNKRQRSRAGFILCGILAALTLSRIASATPPAMLVYFVDIDGMTTVAAQYLDSDIATRLHDDLRAGADLAPPLLNPFDDHFTALSQVPTAGFALAKAWRSMATSDNRRQRFTSFLGAVNQAGAVRAIITSSRYSGCLAVELSLRQDAERPVLLENLSAITYAGCLRHPSKRSFESSNALMLD